LSHSYRYDIKEKETTSSSMALKARVSQRETSIEASTAYDMLGPEENKFLDNFSDINAILNYKFPFWSFYLGSRTDVSPLKLKSINTDFNYSPFKGDWQNPEVRGWYFRDRVVYAGRENQDPSELKMDVTNTLGCWIGRGIRVNFTLRMDFFPFAYSRFTERLLTLYKDLHCWEMSFTWDKRLKEEQFWVKFTLKAVPEARLGGYHNVEKDEWRLLTE